MADKIDWVDSVLREQENTHDRRDAAGQQTAKDRERAAEALDEFWPRFIDCSLQAVEAFNDGGGHHPVSRKDGSARQVRGGRLLILVADGERLKVSVAVNDRTGVIEIQRTPSALGPDTLYKVAADDKGRLLFNGTSYTPEEFVREALQSWFRATSS